MPQSLKVHALETTDIPEHRAQTAVNHQKTANPTPHEETVSAEDHSNNAPHPSSLVHGKAASLQVAAKKKASATKGRAVEKLKAAATNRSNHMIALGAGALALGIFHISRSR